MPFPSFPVAPIATVFPSLESETLLPLLSPAASPLITAPICVQVPDTFLYTRTEPEKDPFPSLPIAPIARVLPSLDMERLLPL